MNKCPQKKKKKNVCIFTYNVILSNRSYGFFYIHRIRFVYPKERPVDPKGRKITKFFDRT